MSIASNFRAKMDVALNSADLSVGKFPDARRTLLSQAIDKADLMLVEKSYIDTLFEELAKLQNTI